MVKGKVFLPIDGLNLDSTFFLYFASAWGMLATCMGRRTMHDKTCTLY